MLLKSLRNTTGEINCTFSLLIKKKALTFWQRGKIMHYGVWACMLTETDSGKYIFCYDNSFLIDEKQTAISLSFPKSQREFSLETLFPFFYNMLSEGTNKAIQCQTLKIDESDAFGLLLATAHTDTIGAIIVKKI